MRSPSERIDWLSRDVQARDPWPQFLSIGYTDRRIEASIEQSVESVCDSLDCYRHYGCRPLLRNRLGKG